jgi:hypothetical protein
MNEKPTMYTEIRNLMIVLNFNQQIQVEEMKSVEMPDGTTQDQMQSVTKYQPIVVDTRADVLTTEGATMGISEKVNVGEPSDTELTHEELYKQLYALSPILAAGNAAVLLQGVNQDISATDVSGVEILTVETLKAQQEAQLAKPVEGGVSE